MQATGSGVARVGRAGWPGTLAGQVGRAPALASYTAWATCGSTASMAPLSASTRRAMSAKCSG